jgi:hypothetical protein
MFQKIDPARQNMLCLGTEYRTQLFAAFNLHETISHLHSSRPAGLVGRL